MVMEVTKKIFRFNANWVYERLEQHSEICWTQQAYCCIFKKTFGL